MADDDLHARIDEMVAEEHALRGAAAGGNGLTDAERDRLRELEQGLDRVWDLVRQRQARRDADQDPGEARERPTGTVEGYLS
ncbi:hypothetical protein GCM10027047_04090 [Rhodococcus aerolatus]